MWACVFHNVKKMKVVEEWLIWEIILQVYVGLSELFGRLQDADKSARYAAKAYDLSRSLQLGDLNSRHHRAALLQMASALRKQGELGDAHDYCSVSNLWHSDRKAIRDLWSVEKTFLLSILQDSSGLGALQGRKIRAAKDGILFCVWNENAFIHKYCYNSHSSTAEYLTLLQNYLHPQSDFSNIFYFGIMIVTKPLTEFLPCLCIYEERYSLPWEYYISHCLKKLKVTVKKR